LNILHISDLHFGPYHWKGNDEALLKKINSYNTDIVINTGDLTTDSMESEYCDARDFLNGIKCDNIISIIGNHDKLNKRSHELFKEYIFKPEKLIYPLSDKRLEKKGLFLSEKNLVLNEYFTDINYLKKIKIGNKTLLAVCIDSNILNNCYGYVEESILNSLSLEINNTEYDMAVVLIHHSLLGTDECPLTNSKRVIDFITRHRVGNVFCGHTHESDIRQSNDIINKHQFTQFVCGSTSSGSISHQGYNMFYYLKNVGEENLQIYIVKIVVKEDKLEFQEERII